MRRLLFYGHGNIESGFGRVSQNILSYLTKTWDVAQVAIGYNGDPHPWPWRMYPAGNEGDQWGLNRLEKIYQREKPDVFAIVMEPWNIMPFVQTLRAGLGSRVKIVAYAVVDGLNMKEEHAHWLQQCDVCIFPTEFAVEQAKAAGYYGYAYVIPHGVNPILYRPCDQQWARKQIGLGNLVDSDAFVFGNVNMNQPRKRIDISMEAFAKFLDLAGRPAEPLLHLHLRKNMEEGWDIGNLAKLFDIKGRVSVMAEELNTTEPNMKYVYNACDVMISTTAGEGFGLTTLEGMACGVPQIIPDFAALGEWAKTGAVTVEAKERQIFHKQQNIVRYVPKAEDMAEAMLEMYRNKELRKQVGRMGRKLALTDIFRWSTIAVGFDEALTKAINAEGKTGKFMVQAEAAGPSGAPLAQSQGGA